MKTWLAPEKYGDDRFFVYLRLAGDQNHDLDRQVAALEANGHPARAHRLERQNTISGRNFSAGSSP